MQSCPSCGKSNNSTTGINSQEQPKPGDVSICFYCAFVSVFDENLKLTPISKQQLESLPQDVIFQISKAKLAILAKRRNGIEKII